MINGRVVTDHAQMASVSSYVQQDDLFIGTLKVREHLEFQAALRMDRSYTKEEKFQRVEEILNSVIYIIVF